ncbi:MAG: Cna B-type domain-containing protein [Oscillospiraceae bacterium]|nr:Cna B-type domain-containing protein [Oscillospiraceae bacterium]
MELDVPADLGNLYANRVGEVDWIFLAEGFTDELLTVHKVWADNNDPDRPERIRVQLLRDGEVYDEVELSEENQWTYTWDQLVETYEWTVVEAEVPAGYEVSYEIKDGTVWITNSNDYQPPAEPEPVDLTVKKVWAGDEKKLDERPTSVSVTLYNGETAVSKVTLSEANGWTYTWTDLDGSGDWSVLETGVPKDYTPSYSEKDGVVTITNTASLIDTGLTNWPIPVLCGLGVLLLACGAYMMLKKRKQDHA